MHRRSLKEEVDQRVGFTPQALSGTNDIVGEIIDRQGYQSLMFCLVTDAIAAGSLDAQLLIEEGDQSNLSDAAAVADADLDGLESATAIAETDDKVVKRIGYIGSKRYVRATLTVTANDGTDVVACVATLGGALEAPVAQG